MADANGVRPPPQTDASSAIGALESEKSHDKTNADVQDEEVVVKSDKGKGKARAEEPEDVDEHDEDEDDDEDEEDDEEDEEDDDDDDDDLDALMDEVDPSEILPYSRQRSARSKPIDYSSADAMQKAGLHATQHGDEAEHAGLATAAADDEDDDEYKADDTMEEA